MIPPSRINVDWDDDEALPGAWMGNAYDAPMEGRTEYVRADLALDRDTLIEELAVDLEKRGRNWPAVFLREWKSKP